MPPTYDQQVGHARRVERASDRKIRERNKISYRLNHWPIWIWVFFIAPGPLTFDLFAHGFDCRMATWLGVVLVGTGIAGLVGQLPGVEPAPYIIRFTEDRPNPLYRRICYTFAWSAVITFAVLNIAGLAWAIVTGEWQLRQIYDVAYFPMAGAIWCLGLLGRLPRVKPSTKNEGHERRYFYGSVWAVCIAQPVLWLLWAVLPRGAAVGRVQAGRLRRHPRLRRQPRASRPAAAHASHRAGRDGGLGLTRGSAGLKPCPTYLACNIPLPCPSLEEVGQGFSPADPPRYLVLSSRFDQVTIVGRAAPAS